MANTKIDCSKLKNCMWSSVSNKDRSNPNDELICPSDKPNMIWRDLKPNEPRRFKCTECNIKDISDKCKTTKIFAQTSKCNLTDTGRKEKDKVNWSANRTVIFNKSCKGKWFKL